MLGRVGLSRFGDQPCGGYSGGMKRKLSFAVALMGNPAVRTHLRRAAPKTCCFQKASSTFALCSLVLF
jgi:hypothetical protein